MTNDWDLTKIPNHEQRCYSDLGAGRRRLHYDTEALIGAATMVEIGKITKNNIDEWHFRIQFLKAIGFDWYRTVLAGHDLGPIYPDYDTIADHIGLRTDVATIARLKWVRHWTRRLELRIAKKIEIEMESRSHNSKARPQLLNGEG